LVFRAGAEVRGEVGVQALLLDPGHRLASAITSTG
jgi:hypothetical protein